LPNHPSRITPSRPAISIPGEATNEDLADPLIAHGLNTMRQEGKMPVYRYDHVHLRSADPDTMAAYFETMFGAEVVRGTYPAGSFYPGKPRVLLKLGGQTVLIAPAHHDEQTDAAPRFPYFGIEHIGLTVDDLDTAVADLRGKGADIFVGPMDYSAGTRLAFVRGPEGVTVEIVQRR
jgi:catechol 2,3-dioxygenase-like lactoylglutathione lyase family enzyme